MANDEGEKDINEILNYDPFEEDNSDDGSDDSSGQHAQDDGGKQPQADGGGDAGSQETDEESQGGSEDSAGADDGSDSSQKSSQSHDPAEERIKALEEQLRQATAALQNLQQGKEGGKEQDQGQGSDSDADSQPEIPSYEFQIPQAISDGIMADDPQQRSAALAQLVKGIGVEVHARVRQEFDDKLRKTVEYQQSQQQTQTQEQQRQQQQEEIRRDYFNTYKNHDSDIIRPVVQRKASEVFQEWNVQTWTPTVRDEIARRVENELRNAGFGGQPAPAQQSNGQDQSPPPHQRKGGSRPRAPAGAPEPNSMQDIESTLFGE